MTYSEPTLDNATLEGIHLSLGRTSYFTMYSMGKDRWSKHPYSKLQVDNTTTYKDILEALDRYEVIIQDWPCQKKSEKYCYAKNRPYHKLFTKKLTIDG